MALCHCFNPLAQKGADMPAKKTATPAVTVTLGDPEDPTKVTAIEEAKPVSEWDELEPAVSMPNKVSVGNIKVNVLESVPEAIRSRAEASLALNAKAVADKPATNAKRARVNYHWDVQRVASKEQGERFDKAISKYGKYRPATGDIPHRAEHSPMGQITVRTGVVCHYRNDDKGIPTVCGEKDEGAYLGLRYSVRPLEQRGDANRLPGTA